MQHCVFMSLESRAVAVDCVDREPHLTGIPHLYKVYVTMRRRIAVSFYGSHEKVE